MGRIQDDNQTSIHVPSEMLATIDKIAAVMERDRTWVILRALRHYLEKGEGREIREDAAGLASLDRGEGVGFETVMDEVDEIICKAKARKTASPGSRSAV